MKRAMMTMTALLPLAFLIPALRHAMEARMAVHMLIQLPLLLAAGWAAAGFIRLPGLRMLDAHGLLGITAGSCVLAVWMIPAALDLSLIWPATAALKYASCWAAGWLLAQSWPRLSAEVLVFFLGNVAWMLATAGLLFQEAESRLCVSYLAEEQIIAGTGLIAWALLLGGLAVRRALALRMSS